MRYSGLVRTPIKFAVSHREDIIPRVQQYMRHLIALRISKAVLVLAIALFYTILVLNNVTDYGSNYEFVRHVLMMDSTLAWDCALRGPRMYSTAALEWHPRVGK